MHVSIKAITLAKNIRIASMIPIQKALFSMHIMVATLYLGPIVSTLKSAIFPFESSNKVFCSFSFLKKSYKLFFFQSNVYFLQ